MLWAPTSQAGDSQALQQRYQLVLIARQAAEQCDWVEADTHDLLQRRAKVLTADLGQTFGVSAARMTEIRDHARRLFEQEGCDSPAIRDLVRTVHAVEEDRGATH